jgi:hypothetical protein
MLVAWLVLVLVLVLVVAGLAGIASLELTA